MRDDLDGAPLIFAVSLLADDGFIDLPGGEIVAAGHLASDKALVVSQIQVGFGAVAGDKNLPVLDRAHRAGVHINIRVQFQHVDLQPAGFQNGAQGGGGDALSQRGDNAAGDEDVFCAVKFGTAYREL